MSDELDPFEIRVLAVLAEKEALTPDSYPMTLNSLVNGCNQLSSRDPVMQLSEETVYDVLQRLMQQKLVNGVTQAGARVAKYEHRLRIKYTLEQDKLAVLAMLMLRGLQTAGEIRARSGRVHEFKTVEAVETALQFLIDKYPPLVAKLPVAPGASAPRYGHLLSGEAALASAESAFGSVAPTGGKAGQLEQEVASLRAEVAELKAQFETFRQQFE